MLGTGGRTVLLFNELDAFGMRGGGQCCDYFVHLNMKVTFVVTTDKSRRAVPLHLQSFSAWYMNNIDRFLGSFSRAQYNLTIWCCLQRCMSKELRFSGCTYLRHPVDRPASILVEFAHVKRMESV